MRPEPHDAAASASTADDRVAFAPVPEPASGLLDGDVPIALVVDLVERGPVGSETAQQDLDDVVTALATCASPVIFAEVLELLLGSPWAIEQVGDRLHAVCLARAALRGISRPRELLLAADALEATTRLTLGGWGSRYAVLGLLAGLPGPVPETYGRAAIRCLAATWERWRDTELLDALHRLAGLLPPLPTGGGGASSSGELAPVSAVAASVDLMDDVAFELGCASLLSALSAPDIPHAREALETAHRRLTAAAFGGEGRPDAAAMADVVLLLMAHLPDDQGRQLYERTDLQLLAHRMEHNVREHVLGYAGLAHWRAPRLDAEVAWTRLAHTVAFTHQRLREPSWYQAATVLSQVLSAYRATRCSHVLQRHDQQGLQTLLAPRVETGIAARAGLMSHLEHHVAALQRQVHDASAGDGELGPAAELEAGRTLLASARRRLVEAETPAPSSATSSQEWPVLHELLGDDRQALAELPPGIASLLEARLAHAMATHHREVAAPVHLLSAEVAARLRRDLTPSPWYRRFQVAAGVNLVLDALVHFWHTRSGLERRYVPYLYDPDALEKDLAADLEPFLGTELGAAVTTEVRHVHGGRVDVAITFPSYRLYIELKQDARQIDIGSMRSYLLQSASYQGLSS